MYTAQLVVKSTDIHFQVTCYVRPYTVVLQKRAHGQEIIREITNHQIKGLYLE